MALSTLSNELTKYERNLTHILFSYRHLVENLVVDRPFLEVLYQAQLLSEEDYHSMINKPVRIPRKTLARELVHILLTKLRARGERLRDNNPLRRLESFNQKDPYETFMEVLLNFNF